MAGSIMEGMIAHFEAAGYDDYEAQEMAQELFEDFDGALEDAHGEDSNLRSLWVKGLVADNLCFNFHLFGSLIAKAYMGDKQAIVDAGFPHQLYDHIMIIS